MSMILALLAAMQAAPATPSAPPVTTETLDPARLKAAGVLLDVLMPPESREAMIDQMLRPLMANLQQGMMANPLLQKDLAENPKMRAVFDRFLARQTERTLTKLRAGMPGMFEAMTRAYARRFTVTQMDDTRAFFLTPSGRAYLQQGMTIMSDPDVASWQRGLMTGAMSDVQSDVAELMAEIQAAGDAK